MMRQPLPTLWPTLRSSAKAAPLATARPSSSRSIGSTSGSSKHTIHPRNGARWTSHLAPFLFHLHHGDEPPHPHRPIGKAIDVFRLPLDGARHAAIVQPDRHQKDLVQRNAAGTVEGVTDLRLKSTALVHRPSRETRHEEVCGLDRRFDGARPILSREQLPYVHPRLEARGRHLVV